MAMELRTTVYVRERSIYASLAARKLSYSRIAIVLGRTIHLHGVTKQAFFASERWVIHELVHVEQYQRYGSIRFLWLYFIGWLRFGYFNHPLEREARSREQEIALLARYRWGNR